MYTLSAGPAAKAGIPTSHAHRIVQGAGLVPPPQLLPLLMLLLLCVKSSFVLAVVDDLVVMSSSGSLSQSLSSDGSSRTAPARHLESLGKCIAPAGHLSSLCRR
jgi:hypothetical protein